MLFAQNSKDSSSPFSLPVLFFITFLLWIFAFKDFVFDKITLSSDALAYYEHFKVFTDGLRRGVFPMWDPTWITGIPEEFFLRRMGSFNPFIWIIIIFNKIGIPYNIAYLLFLSCYYFFGMVGFYLLAKRIIKDSAIAFLAYLLLMFSSLGTRMFDSYILLTFVPMVWFFFFCVAFCQNPQRFYFLGLIFSLMILFTTYIPFYFITIFLTFLISLVILYFAQLKEIAAKALFFIKGNKGFVILCCLFFFISLWPGCLFYKEAQKGEMVFFERHSTSSVSNQVSVGIETVTSWGIEEDIAYASAFTDLKRFKFAILYISFFAYLIFLLGIITDVNRKILFLFVWAGLLILITTPRLSGIYDYLYQHVFYFKYFRNLHFFLWLVLLPIFILFLSGQLKNLLSFQPKTKTGRIGFLTFITLVHAGFLYFIYSQGSNIASSYAVVILSWLFLTLYFLGRIKTCYLPIIFLVIVIIQPLEVYHYLSRNSIPKVKSFKHVYESDYLFPRMIQTENKLIEMKQSFAQEIKGLSHYAENKTSNSYIGLKWMNLFKNNLNLKIFDEYSAYKIVLYDHVEWMKDDQVDFERLGKAIANSENVAFISESPQKEGVGALGSSAQIITAESKEVKILKYDFNDVILKTNLNKEKFLVYNDSYHSGWHVFIDGKEAPLFRTNVAFKGVWVPAGEHQVWFRFGTALDYFRNYFLLMMFYAVFIYLLFLGKNLYSQKVIN